MTRAGDMRELVAARLVMLVAVSAMAWALAGGTAVAVSADDEVRGVALPASPVNGSLTTTTYPYALDLNDVYRISLGLNDRLEVTMTVPAGADFDVYLFSSAATSVAGALRPPYSQVLAYSGSTVTGRTESFTYVYDRSTVTTCYVDVKQWKGSGRYTLSWRKTRLPSPSVATTIAAPVPYGGSAVITGTATWSDWPLGNLPAQVQVMPFGGKAWVPVMDATTTPDGRFSVRVKPSGKTTYRIRTRWAVGPLGQGVGWGFGPAMTVTPGAHLQFASWPKTIQRGRLFKVWGYHKPAHSAASSTHVRVRAWKRTSTGTWHYYGSFRARNSGERWEASYALPTTGTWMLKATVPTDDDHRFTLSTPRYISVTR